MQHRAHGPNPFDSFQDKAIFFPGLACSTELLYTIFLPKGDMQHREPLQVAPNPCDPCTTGISKKEQNRILSMQRTMPAPNTSSLQEVNSTDFLSLVGKTRVFILESYAAPNFHIWQQGVLDLF
jgi:hypothetical protein